VRLTRNYTRGPSRMATARIDAAGNDLDRNLQGHNTFSLLKSTRRDEKKQHRDHCDTLRSSVSSRER